MKDSVKRKDSFTGLVFCGAEGFNLDLPCSIETVSTWFQVNADAFISDYAIAPPALIVYKTINFLP